MSQPMGDNYNFMSKLDNHTLNPSKRGGSIGWVNLKERQSITKYWDTDSNKSFDFLLNPICIVVVL